MIGLDQRAVVYGPDSNGDYTVILKGATEADKLRCRAAHVRGGATPSDRAEIAQLRNLIWEAGYDMPENCLVKIDTVSYNPVAGTFMAYRGPSGSVVYRRCDVVEAR